MNMINCKALALTLMVIFFVPWTSAANEINPLNITEASSVAPGCRAPVILQKNSAIASGMSVYLVAWSDGSRQPVRASADIYCARITNNTHKALDPEGIPVCDADYIQGYPSVAFNGKNFLIVWQDFRNGKNYDIYAARVSQEGKVLDPGGFPVANRPNNQARPAVAYANGIFFVVWMDGQHYPVYSLFGARVTNEGRCLDPDGIQLDAEPEETIKKVKPPTNKWLGDKESWWATLCSRATPSIAFDGKHCLIAYRREIVFRMAPRVYATALLIEPASGKSLGPPVILKGMSPEDRPAVTATPNNWAIALDHWQPGWGYTPSLACVLIAAEPKGEIETIKKNNKEILVPHEILEKGYATGKGQTCPFQPAIAWNGKHLVLAMEFGWRETIGKADTLTAILVNRFDPKAMDQRFFIHSKSSRVDISEDAKGASVSNPAIAAGPGGECLLVYEKDTGINHCELVTRVITESH